MLERRIICTNGRWKVGLTHFRPMDQMAGVCVYWRVAGDRPFSKIFATGTENPLKDRHCFFCMICRRNVSMKSQAYMNWSGTFSGNIIWGQIRGLTVNILQKYVIQMGVLYMVRSWRQRRNCSCVQRFRNWIINNHFTMTWLSGSPLILLRQVRELWYRLNCCWYSSEEEANWGPCRNSGLKWECWRVILRAPLTSIGVLAIFL